MANRYSQISVGNIFKAGGENFRKLDDLYYEDVTTGLQAMWNPLFDGTIHISNSYEEPKREDVNTTDKFLVNPQNRMMTVNPNYKERDTTAAEKAFAKAVKKRKK